MAATVLLVRLQALVDNPLPDRVAGALIGLIGERPSSYSRSPQLWVPALQRLRLDATYLPLDVSPGHLDAVLAALREMDGCWGANVTVPYKEAVVPLLDDLDGTAAAAGAVNTIVRRRAGTLVGANTDGVGLVAALLHDDGRGPLVDTLYGQTVLLIGAGGAARAAAVTVAPLVGTGELIVTNRSHDGAEGVAEKATATGVRARAVPEGDLDEVLQGVDLVINASVRGQTGVRRQPEGWVDLEQYSSLAPASPAILLPPDPAPLRSRRIRPAPDIRANRARSRARMRRLPPHAAVYDMIYAPVETVMLRHAREAGLRAANGRWMMIVQAAEACVAHICRATLESRGVDLEAARSEAIDIMAAAWDG